MKKSLFFPIALLLLCGCASSDRMVRMSGGIIEEYSAPKSFRLRSEKYQAKSKVLSSEKKLQTAKVAGLDDTLVNIWPFFFAANSYWSVLWPMIDCDDYGFAVRPFFNKEGDDWSVLFPLSAWNTASKSGWAANFVWRKNAFGFIPLTWQRREKDYQKYYYTPLFYSEFSQKPLEFRYRQRRTDKILFCCLAYALEDTFVNRDSSPHSWLLNYYGTNEDFPNEWRYRYRNGNAPGKMPANEKELKKLQKSIFSTLKVEKENTWGFAPLWHYSSDSRGNYDWRLMLFLAGAEKKLNSHIWSVLLYVDKESSNGNNPFQTRHPEYEKARKSWDIIFLAGAEEKLRYLDKTGSTFRKFKDLSHNSWNEPFNAALPRLTKQLKEIDPTVKIPKEVKDWNTFYIFRRELAEKYSFETESHRKLVLFPLLFLDSSPAKKSWFSPLLLTGAEKNNSESRFTSIPLMTFSRTAKDDGYTAVVPPLGYWNNYENKKRIDKKIYSSGTKWADKHNVVGEENHYALLGLFYRGRHAFTVAKKGIDAQTAEFIRKELLLLSGKFKNLEKRKKSLAEERRNNEAWKTADKIEYYKKMIRFEELKLKEANIAKDEKMYIESRKKVKAKAESLGFTIGDRCFKEHKEAEKFLVKLFDTATELRWKEDIGNGIFFRKEKFYNGDYNWNLLGVLARGEKNGERESSSVLHLLYRYRKEGNRSETLFFPFVSHVEDGKNHRTSFLWRLFSIGERNGKTGGHILFIPFGERL